MGTITHYQKRISGPLLDRIDYCRRHYIEVPRVEAHGPDRGPRAGEADMGSANNAPWAAP